MTGNAPRARPDVADVFRTPPDEAVERAGGIAAAAPLVAPGLIVGAVAVFFIPPLQGAAPYVAIGLLALSPVVLSLAWRHWVSAPQARRATIATAVLLGLAAGGLGLLANPCAADPGVTAVTSLVAFVGTLLVATLVGGALARGGWPVPALVAAAVIGIGGFYASLNLVARSVFVLC